MKHLLAAVGMAAATAAAPSPVLAAATVPDTATPGAITCINIPTIYVLNQPVTPPISICLPTP